MTARLEYSVQAQEDMDGIWDHIADDNPVAAENMLRRIDERCRALAENPELGELWSILGPDVRMFTVGRYAIFYRPARNGIRVARVLHSARDIRTEFDRE